MKVYTAILPVFTIGIITATAKTKENAKDLLLKRYYETEVKNWKLRNGSYMSPMTEQTIKRRIQEDESDIIYQTSEIGKTEILSTLASSDRYALTIERS